MRKLKVNKSNSKRSFVNRQKLFGIIIMLNLILFVVLKYSIFFLLDLLHQELLIIDPEKDRPHYDDRLEIFRLTFHTELHFPSSRLYFYILYYRRLYWVSSINLLGKYLIDRKNTIIFLFHVWNFPKQKISRRYFQSESIVINAQGN